MKNRSLRLLVNVAVARRVRLARIATSPLHATRHDMHTVADHDHDCDGSVWILSFTQRMPRHDGASLCDCKQREVLACLLRGIDTPPKIWPVLAENGSYGEGLVSYILDPQNPGESWIMPVVSHVRHQVGDMPTSAPISSLPRLTAFSISLPLKSCSFCQLAVNRPHPESHSDP